MGRNLQKFLWDGRFKMAGLTGPGVNKCKDLSVQSHAADGIRGRSVFFIPNNRMPDVLHMHPNLVFPARVEIDLQ